jgi:hypothetical protein
MNWTCKLLAVAIATVASISVNLYAQSTLPKGSKLPFENVGACRQPARESRSSGEPYDVAEAYEVYSVIIPTVAPNPEKKMWFIRIDTVPTDQVHKRKQASSAHTALDDYFKVNTKTWLLQRTFTLPKPYELVTSDEIKAMFPSSFRGGRFGELWLELSAVGFNADKTQAVVYMEHFCTADCCCADGRSFVLQKQNGKWEVLSGLECWVS